MAQPPSSAFRPRLWSPALKHSRSISRSLSNAGFYHRDTEDTEKQTSRSPEILRGEVDADKTGRFNGGSFELVELDLADLKSVGACADALVAKGKPFDMVIANAGVMAIPFGHTADG